jgi:hypothetical protein
MRRADAPPSAEVPASAYVAASVLGGRNRSLNATGSHHAGSNNQNLPQD